MQIDEVLKLLKATNILKREDLNRSIGSGR
jgi:hypothetical protein